MGEFSARSLKLFRPPLKRIAVWTALLLLPLLLLAALLQLAGTWAVNHDPLKGRIETTLSRTLGGRLRYERLRFSVVPRLHLVIQQPSLSIPGRVSAALKSLEINLELLPLLRGRLRVADARLDHPEITLTVEGASRAPTGSGPGSGRSLAAMLGVMASAVPNLTIRIEQGRLTMTENHQQLLSLREIGGRVTMSPAGPAELFRIAGNAEAVLTDDAILPGPVRIRLGAFNADSRSLSFSHGEAAAIDAAITFAGRIDQYLAAEPAAEIAASGRVGSKAVKWARAAAALPEEWTLRAPVAFSQLRFFWKAGGAARVEGAATLPDNLWLTFDLERRPERFIIHELRLRDNDSQAALTLDIQGRVIDWSFSGQLARATFDRLFEQQRVDFGWVKGEFRSRVVLDRPRESTAQGRLEGERLVLPVQTRLPLLINRVVIQAAARTVGVEPLTLTVGTTRQTVRGRITALPDRWLVDLTADRLAWEPWSGLFASNGQRDGPASSGRRPFPFVATIRASTAVLTIGRWVVAPARVEIVQGPDRLKATVKEAVVCGVKLPGVITVGPAHARIDVMPSAADLNLENTLACLGELRHQITGTVKLSGELSGELSGGTEAAGAGQRLLETLHGTIAVAARKGRVRQGSLAMQILSYLNVTDLLRGQYPDPGREGLPYDALVIRATVNKGLLSLDEAVFTSPTVNLTGQGSVTLSDHTINLTVLAAPFTSTDAVIKKIPLIKEILAGALVTIPLRVTGPLDRPEVKSIPPAAVAEGLANIMKRTLQSPIQIMEPLLPEQQKRDQ